MEGVMRAEFIEAVNGLRLAERWLTPFFRISETVPPKKILRKFIEPYSAGGVPVFVQLMGVNSNLLQKAAGCFLELGATGIDLNCGCPSRRVVNGGAGGGMLRNPETISGIIRDLRKIVPAGRLSIKLRTGFSHPQEICSWLPELSANVDRIFLHYRTVVEGYTPAPERVERLKRVISLISSAAVIINGDISTVEEGRSLLHDTGGAGIMAARGWLKDPWLLRRFTDMNVPGPNEGRELFWKQLCTQNIAKGGLIELAGMIFGVNDPKFKQLIKPC